MENKWNSKIVGDGGVLKVPIGYRFLPSDVQLLSCYLIPKNLRHVLPADIIPTIDVFQTNPWDLPGDSREKRYFFCERGSKVNRYKLVTSSSYWKATGKQQIIWSNEQQSGPVPIDDRRKAIGLKRKLTFCPGRRNLAPHPAAIPGSATTHEWVIWEYRMATSINNRPNSDENVVEEVGDWMVCAISFEEKKKPIKNNGTRVQRRKKTINEMENVGDGNVIDCHHHPLMRSTLCCDWYWQSNNFVTQNNYETTLSPDQSSTASSCSTMTLTSGKVLLSDDEATSTSLD